MPPEDYRKIMAEVRETLAKKIAATKKPGKNPAFYVDALEENIHINIDFPTTAPGARKMPAKFTKKFTTSRSGEHVA